MEYVDKRIGTSVSAAHVATFVGLIFVTLTVVFFVQGMRKDYKRRKNSVAGVKTLDILLCEASAAILLLDLCALYTVFGGANRAFGVVGMSFVDPGGGGDNTSRTLLEDDYCTLNSAATAGCEAQSYLYALAVCLLTSAVAMCAIELYCSIVTKLSKKRIRSFLPFYQLYIWSVSLFIPALAHTFGVHGPQAAFCGMRCMELGMDDDFAPEGRCVFRLLQYCE